MRGNERQTTLTITLGGGAGAGINTRAEFKQVIEYKDCSTLIFS
jgi:hypothetical protein